jgi:hypothetical protein
MVEVFFLKIRYYYEFIAKQVQKNIFLVEFHPKTFNF